MFSNCQKYSIDIIGYEYFLVAVHWALRYPLIPYEDCNDKLRYNHHIY